MPELETKKYSTDELRPLLSLKPAEQKKDDEKTREEQEALWNRSLEFFQKMKKNNAQHA
ncbi:MAG: hypothetical protein IJU23_06035 [Proteobacteria bacterium]|nr:hypothetical protein [Pseudomonadota bacterium]